MAENQLASVDLSDKYTLDRGRILLSGRQALVRLPLMQRQLDRARGLKTAGFISGYRGSPLGTYDLELQRARDLLEQNDILFQPGLNEDLAATAIWGTQQLGFLPGRKVQGVFSIWYGKGPGVDRSGDPFKHANLAGTEPHGGVLLVFGDDHAGKSSSTAHQSDLALAAHDIPVLYPATVSEILELGLAGIELSRFSGLLVGLKIVNETADTTSTVNVDTDGYRYTLPNALAPPGGVHIRREFLALQEQDVRLVRYKLPRALAFARANGLDRLVFGAPRPKFLIVTAGKAYTDVMSALELLGISDAAARQIGLGVYKVGMIYPLEPEGLRRAAQDADEILFVEEKRPHLERQAPGVLFNLTRRPALSGKFESEGAPLLPADVPLDPLTVAQALSRRLSARVPQLDETIPEIGNRRRTISAQLQRRASIDPGPLSRRPAFCPGCPHNTSTAVPAGSFGMTGIGCHAMAMFIPDRNPLPVAHMGGEGAAWLGLAPFTTTEHVFQNIGDGTYNHSGSMAIRAAVQAGVHITYKILYNDAVAMTGGQPVEGGQTVSQIAAQVLAEGVARVVVVSSQGRRFRKSGELPAGVRAHPREELEWVQKSLRDTPGVTVLIYDQTCAAEERRRRKRGQSPDPDRRVFINERVCEGCGDCSVQSNCLAIQPLETDLGRKRIIDQSACNKDESCTRGFCPSFVTVEGARLRRPKEELPTHLFESLPEPEPPRLTNRFDILLAGVGGTGVVTISAVIGMAAHLEGRGANTYDMTGLSQKGGAVYSHVRLTAHPDMRGAATIPSGCADLLLACDAVAATHRDALLAIDAQRTAVLVNGDITATGQFQTDPDLKLEPLPFREILTRAAGGRAPLAVEASSLAVRLLGDTIATNMVLLGCAWQCGHIPLSRAALERAIKLNNIGVAFNLRAFAIGRAAAVHSARTLLEADAPTQPLIELPTADLDTFVARRVEDLTAYWSRAYAEMYRALVHIARRHEAALGLGTDDFGWAVARSAYKLMAYKDEYEVARLYTDGRFRAALNSLLEPGYRLKFQFAPPLLARTDSNTGRPRKVTLGSWVASFLSALARLKVLRETPVDPFGYTTERRLERQLRDQYLEFIRVTAPSLTQENHRELVAVAQLPLKVRGFGLVKQPASDELSKQLDAPAERAHPICPRR
jgi:indolepyruvate ferredoxin oxidoreductase